ncbi:hypothetical protein LP419_32860 [Massilia sp. H-1]|nr:hypothetical protein LP419_32860 [Massilia sp. H-1]
MIETTNPNLIPVSAEIFLLIAASAILLIDMFLSESKRADLLHVAGDAVRVRLPDLDRLFRLKHHRLHLQ